MQILGAPVLFAPDIVSTKFSDVRLTISHDGRTALWFSRDRPGGPGGYDIWISRRTPDGWGEAAPVSFNSAHRDFDPALSPDGRYVYFCSDRPGGLGGDDLYRVAFTEEGFGEVESLGPRVNSSGNEWAPMLSSESLLLFSSNGRGGAGRLDLFTARLREDGGFDSALPLEGEINTAADEFDATFLADGSTLVFSRAPDLKVDQVRLFHAAKLHGRYDVGKLLPESVNPQGKDAYGPMLDWSCLDRMTFSTQRTEAHAGSTDLYVINYRLADDQGSGCVDLPP